MAKHQHCQEGWTIVDRERLDGAAGHGCGRAERHILFRSGGRSCSKLKQETPAQAGRLKILSLQSCRRREGNKPFAPLGSFLTCSELRGHWYHTAMALTSANYIFLPWVRQGAASGIKTPDMSANQPGVVSVRSSWASTTLRQISNGKYDSMDQATSLASIACK